MRMLAPILKILKPAGRTLERRFDLLLLVRIIPNHCHPKAAGEEGEEKGGAAGNVERRSTRAWAQV